MSAQRALAKPSACKSSEATKASRKRTGFSGGDVILQPFGEEQRLGAVQSSAMVHA